MSGQTETDIAPAATARRRPRGQAEEHPTAEVCPHFHAAIELIGKRWSGAILWALSDRPLRFGELNRAVPGVSDRLLSQRLRELEQAGLMERRVEDGTPVKVTYSLTEKGLALRPAIRSLREWACEWQDPE